MASKPLDKMKELVRHNNTCVLATTSEGKPHCSLMAYAVDDACGEMFMGTHRNTVKYQNLLRNGNVSLLIDTRAENPGEKRTETKALTVAGTFQTIGDVEKRQKVLKKLVERHPHLKDFLQGADTEIFSVKIQSFLLLEGVANACFERV